MLPVPDLAEQYEGCLPEQGNASDLDRLLLCRGAGPFGVRAEHTWVGTGALPASRCEASNGLTSTSTLVHLPASNRTVLAGVHPRRVEDDVLLDRVVAGAGSREKERSRLDRFSLTSAGAAP